MNEDAKHTLTHGGLGLSVGMIGTITSMLPAIEQWLRLMVLLLSLIATGLSVWKLWRGRKGGDGGTSMPWWTMALAVASILLLPGCATSAPRDTPAHQTAAMVEHRTTVRGFDGRIFRLVRKGRNAGYGTVSEADLWQPVGATGQGLPVYTRQLQLASDTSDPIFTSAGVLK